MKFSKKQKIYNLSIPCQAVRVQINFHFSNLFCDCILELRVSLRHTGLRKGWTVACSCKCMLHCFPNFRLLAVSEQSTRSATLTVAVTHPGTNEHNCCLTSNSDLTTIFPLSYWYWGCKIYSMVQSSRVILLYLKSINKTKNIRRLNCWSDKYHYRLMVDYVDAKLYKF